MATQQLNALKTINNLQRDGSLQDLLLSIKDTKTKIDALTRVVSDQKLLLQQKAQEEKRKQEPPKKRPAP